MSKNQMTTKLVLTDEPSSVHQKTEKVNIVLPDGTPLLTFLEGIANGGTEAGMQGFGGTEAGMQGFGGTEQLDLEDNEEEDESTVDPEDDDTENSDSE